MVQIAAEALEWSGEVTFRQLLSWIRSLRGGGRVPDEMLQRAQRLFRTHDADESQGLDRSELQALLRAMEVDPVTGATLTPTTECDWWYGQCGLYECGNGAGINPHD